VRRRSKRLESRGRRVAHDHVATDAFFRPHAIHEFDPRLRTNASGATCFVPWFSVLSQNRLVATNPSPDTPVNGESPLQGFSYGWRALRHRNFRLFFAGQSISLIGTWMTRVATSWLIYRLTGSALLLGLVSFAGQIPTFLLAPFAGVMVDRLDRRKILVWTQTLAAVQSLALAVLTLAKIITVHEVLWLSVLQGLINAFDMPGRQSFLVQMVEDKRDLGNAIALNSSMVNIARLIGPALAGFVIGSMGEGYCFLIDGISYLAVIASLLMMRVSIAASTPSKASMLAQLKDGWNYVTGFPPVRTILSLFALISLMGMPFMVLMPIFAAQVLHGGPHTLGFLLGASGVGALISAVSLALRKTVRGLTTMIQLSAALFGLGLIGFGLSRFFALSLLLMLIVGFGMMQGMAASNTVIQTLVPDDKRGRVMSFYTMAFMGMAPFGSLLAGSLAHRFGAPHAVMITGAFCVAGSIWFTTQLKSIRQVMRPIYIELGIIRSTLEPAMEDQVGS
jgi:MFS family permease